MYFYCFNPISRWRQTLLFLISTLLFTTNCIAQAPKPTISSISPLTICQGNVVTIKGADFTGATLVKLGSANASEFKVVDDNTITATVAYTASSGRVEVTTAEGTTPFPTDLTILSAPNLELTHEGALDNFANCNGNATYTMTVSNSSTNISGSNTYTINWGDNTPPFTSSNWATGAQTSHTYTSQGYFDITFTVTPTNGCTKTWRRRFYNGQNPIASFSTTSSTTGLCAPAPIEFQIGNWFQNSTGTTYVIDFGDGTPTVTLTHPLNATNTVRLISHTYNTSSCPQIDFTATLKAINGCFTTTYTLNQIIIRKKPVADFTTTPNPGCVDAPICFTNTTIDGFSGNNSCLTTANFLWDFGDGSTSSLRDPSCHTYKLPGTYNVKLTAVNATCGNDVKIKQVVVLASSTPPIVSPRAYCQGAKAVALTATGTGLKWYTSPNGGAGSSTAPIPLTGNSGVQTFYVSQTENNRCESQRVPITVTVNAPPSEPTVTSPVQLCHNQTASPLTATGTGLLWYTISNGGTGSATAPTPSTATPGSTTYYVSQTTNTCEGPRAPIVVMVNALASAPIVNSPLVYCQNQTAPALTANGTGLRWYTISMGGTGSPIAPIPSTATPGSTTYYVSQVTGCGEGPRVPITVTVNPGPTATISYTPHILCNATTATPVAVVRTGTGNGVYSVSPAGLTINANTGEINPAGASPGTYTVKYTIAGAGGCATFSVSTTVAVNGSPTAGISYPALCSSMGPTVVNRTGSAGGTFSSTPGLTIDPSTGTITPASSIAAEYMVTYAISPSGPCPGYSTTTKVTVTKAPAATIAYTPSTLCNVQATSTILNPPVPVTHTGTAGGTYSVSPAGLPINGATGEINPSGAAPGTYTIRYSIAGAGGCADYSVATRVDVNSTPTASISYPPICSADALTNVTLTGNAGGAYSSVAGLVLNTSTGAITPAASTPGTYIVTYTIPESAPCPGFTTTASVTITPAPTAAISYASAVLCNVMHSAATPNPLVPVNQTGTAGGTYSTQILQLNKICQKVGN